MTRTLFCLGLLLAIGCGGGQSVQEGADTGATEGAKPKVDAALPPVRDGGRDTGAITKVDAGHDATMTDGGRACVPGQQINCGCPGGGPMGVQVCSQNGSGYSPCQCEDAGKAVDAGHDVKAPVDSSMPEGGKDATTRDAATCSLPPPVDAGTPGNLNWMGRYGLTYAAWPSGVAVDPASGNIATTGYYYGTMNFGGGVVDAGTDANADDGFIASFDSSGSYRWAKSFGNGSISTGSIGFDNTGNEIMSAFLFEGGTADLGCGSVTATGADAVLLIKLDSSGHCVWNNSFASAQIDSVVADSHGNIFIGGEADDGTVDFGGGTLPGGFFIVKFDPSGTYLWNVNVTASCDESSPTLAVDAVGNAIISGCFIGTANFGGGTFTSQGGGDAFVAKYDSSGAYVWAKDYPAIGPGNCGSDVGAGSLGVDACGNVFIAGNFGAQDGTATIDFGNTVSLSSDTGYEFLAKIDATGDAVWAKAFGPAPSEVSAYGLAVNGAGRVTFTTVLYAGTVNFGGGSLGGSVAFASFDGDGNYRWAYSPGDAPATLYRMGVGGVAAGADNVLLLGQFGGSCVQATCTASPPGTTMIVDGQTLTAVSALDMFLASVVP